MIKRIFYLSLFLLISVGVDAQNYVDLLKFRYADTPANQFDSSSAETRVQETSIDLTLPIVLKNNKTFISGLTFQNTKTKVNPVHPSLTSVYTILLKLGLNIKHNEKWSGTYMLLPKLSSDLKEISSNDFQFGAYVLMKYKQSDNLSFQFGMYYNNELFGPFFVPLLGLYYLSPNKRFEINASLPVWADMNYRFYDWFKLGMSFSAFVRTYNINEPQFSEKGEYLVKSTNEPMIYLQFEPMKSIIIQTKIGHAIDRSYRIYDEKDKVVFGLSAFRIGDHRNQLNSDFEDGLIFEVRVLYRFYISNDK